MSNGSISLLQANVALTTNIKLVVDSKYNLYFESYSANSELSDKKYKKYLINSDVFLSERIASFYKDLPIDIAFDVKNDIKSDTIQNTFENQYDDIYYSGARSIEDTRYQEEFQYNTTLKINPLNLPEWFFIFRVDGTGMNPDINVDNFFNSFKVVKTFDLSPKESLGKLFEKNYITDDEILSAPIELNFKEFEFSQWNGYDYYSGGTVSKSFFMDEIIQNETTEFDLESFLIDGFQKNGVINSNFINISYLFDDTVSGVFLKSTGAIKYSQLDYPIIVKLIKNGYIESSQYVIHFDNINNISTTYYTFNENITYKKQWTINRYSGFYANNLKYLNKISNYTSVNFKVGENIKIINNVFKVFNTLTNDYDNINPIVFEYSEQFPIYFKIDTDFYLVEKSDLGEYNLVSDKNINGDLDQFVNDQQKPIIISYQKHGDINNDEYHPYILNNDNSFFRDELIFENIFDSTSLKSSIILIKIIDDFYKVNIDSLGNYYLNTDEYIYIDTNQIYRKLGNHEARITSLNISTKDNNIDYFEFFLFEFTDIKNWDYNRLNTKYAQIEYDKTDIVNYSRPGIYMTNINDTSYPKDLYYEKYYNIYTQMNPLIAPVKLNESDVFILPLASEYAASGDLYMLDNLDHLTRIWDINQTVTKWGIMNSIGSNASPYKINNSIITGGLNNLTPNLKETNVSLNDLNLDWFYTIGCPINYDYSNFNTLNNYTEIQNITFRTLNLDMFKVEPQNLIENVYQIDLQYYKSIDAKFDYFDYILNSPTKYNYGVSNNLIHHERISYLQPTDNVVGPSFFFKGLKTYVQYVELQNPNVITDYTMVPANDLSGYGFAVVFNKRCTDDVQLYGKAGIEIILNKKFKNILVNLYIYTPHNSYTSLDFRERDVAYSEEYVLYSLYTNIPPSTVWKQSELPMKSLTLATFVNIINEDALEYEHFSAGIKYTVIDDVLEYKINSVQLDDGDIFLVRFYLDKPINFKQGEWINGKNFGLTEYDKNLQIVKKIGNSIFTVRFNTDQTPNMVTINNIINTTNIHITKAESVLPFKFTFINPDELKIDSSVNVLTSESNCPITPNNSFKSNTDILITKTDNGLIPNVYVDDSITRKMVKKNINKELNYIELDQLQRINRFSGLYEPILTNINLFNKTNLRFKTHIETGDITGISLDVNNNIILDVTSTNNMKVGDIIYIKCDFTYLKKRTTHITNINGNLITIAIQFSGILPVSTVDFELYIYKVVDKNTSFEFNYQDFAMNDNIIITKNYEVTNPMQSSIDINKTTNKFAMIDEHGVTYINRNIFKSQWDLNYYYSILNNKYTNI